jgi:hypothetical protein
VTAPEKRYGDRPPERGVLFDVPTQGQVLGPLGEGAVAATRTNHCQRHSLVGCR